MKSLNLPRPIYYLFNDPHHFARWVYRWEKEFRNSEKQYAMRVFESDGSMCDPYAGERGFFFSLRMIKAKNGAVHYRVRLAGEEKFKQWPRANVYTLLRDHFNPDVKFSVIRDTTD